MADIFAAIRGALGGNASSGRRRFRDMGDGSVAEVVAAAGVGAGATETTITPAAVVLVASTAKTLLAANTARIRAIITNPLATALYVRKATLAGSAASTTNFDFIVPANGGSWLSDPYEWAGEYNGFCTTAGSVYVSESV